MERGGEDPALEAAARRDIETFTLLAELDWDQVLAEVGGKAPREYGPVLANLPRWRGSSPFSFAELTELYRANGAGLFARHRAFLWEDGALCPVEQPDCPGADESFLQFVRNGVNGFSTGIFMNEGLSARGKDSFL